MQDKLNELKSILAEVADLNKAGAVLGWDQQTYMPRAGAEARGQQMGTLGKIAHEKFTSDRRSANCSTNSRKPITPNRTSSRSSRSRAANTKSDARPV